jgi:hypothetical protein
MTSPDFESLERLCNETSATLESIEEPALSWAVYQQKLLGRYQSLMRRKRKLLERFPEDWEAMALNEAAASQVFAYPGRIRKFARFFAEELKEEQAELLRRFEQTPWFYCLFSVGRELGGAFFEIEDLEHSTQRLLFSPGVRELVRSGVPLFLCLMFDNGSCLQTAGLIHYYRGYQPFDFHYFAKLLQPDSYRAHGLGATIAANPGRFALLDSSAEIPPIVHRGGPVELCDQEIHAESFDAGRLAGKELELTSVGEVLRLRLKGDDTLFRSGSVFFDPGKRKLMVHTFSMRVYGHIRELLRPAVSIPEEPEWHATMNMVVTAQQVLDKQPPSAAYYELFDHQEHPEPTPEVREELEKLNALGKELSDCYNSGRPYSLEALAARHGVQIEAARRLEQGFHGPEAASQIHVAGGLPGYRPPPPVLRQQFRLSPWRGRVFMFLDSPRVRELYTSIQPSLTFPFAEWRAAGRDVELPPPSLEQLPEWLEELYFDTMQDRDFTLLNATLHMLCTRGEVFEGVRDYAAQLLRLFWQVFTPEQQPLQLERFLRRYSRFCYEVLHLGGLAEIDPQVSPVQARKAVFGMRPSAFLRAWIRLR